MVGQAVTVKIQSATAFPRMIQGHAVGMVLAMHLIPALVRQSGMVAIVNIQFASSKLPITPTCAPDKEPAPLLTLAHALQDTPETSAN